jgi:hypothetical protein
MAYSEWFSPDSSATRTIVLTGAEGVLVVRDVLVPGAGLDGSQTGPVWHFSPANTPVVSNTPLDEAMVMGQGASLNAMIRFDVAAFPAGKGCGAGKALALYHPWSVGFQNYDAWDKPGQKSGYARTTAAAGLVHTFVSVLVPVINTSHARWICSNSSSSSSNRMFDAAPRLRCDRANLLISMLSIPPSVTIVQSCTGMNATIKWDTGGVTKSVTVQMKDGATIPEPSWIVHRSSMEAGRRPERLTSDSTSPLRRGNRDGVSSSIIERWRQQ